MRCDHRGVSFRLNGIELRLAAAAAAGTLLDLLREAGHVAAAADDGCGGACGACTVLVARPPAGETGSRFAPARACRCRLRALDGAAVVTLDRIPSGAARDRVATALAAEGARRAGREPGAIAARPRAAPPPVAPATGSTAPARHAPALPAPTAGPRAADARPPAGTPPLALSGVPRTAAHPIAAEPGGLRLSPGVPLAAALPLLAESFPQLDAFWARLAAETVRGDAAGGAVLGSPLCETAPALVALGSRARLAGEAGEMSLEAAFARGGGATLAPAPPIESVFVPKPPPGTLIAAYRVARPMGEAVPPVRAAFRVRFEAGRTAAARLVFGGLAVVPERARNAEAALVGRPWDEAALAGAFAALALDVTPIADWHVVAEHRRLIARNLLRRFWLEAGARASRMLRSRRGGAGR